EQPRRLRVARPQAYRHVIVVRIKPAFELGVPDRGGDRVRVGIAMTRHIYRRHCTVIIAVPCRANQRPKANSHARSAADPFLPRLMRLSGYRLALERSGLRSKVAIVEPGERPDRVADSGPTSGALF